MTTWKTTTPEKLIAVLVTTLGLTVPVAAAGAGPFSRMAGIWSGRGRVILSDGQVEHIRCRASDEVGDRGDLMRQHLRCASPDYNFDVQNMVTADRGRIAGKWDETTRNIGGQVTGVASPGWVRARIEGGRFTADGTLASAANSLRVTLDPHGTDVRQVAVLQRRA
jgi:hypothetical protein